MVADMKAVIAGALALLACTQAGAQPLPDPTRPPPGLGAASAASAAEAPAALVLQSVLLGPGRTPAAVISGRLVALGETVGDARLARVTRHTVELRGAQGTTTLTLMPAGQKTTRPAPAETAR